MRHSDTERIGFVRGVSIPSVSDGTSAAAYYPAMPHRDDAWRMWPKRLKAHVKEKGSKWSEVAEKLGRTEAGVRHWLNGTRKLSLEEFFELCVAAEADPGLVLFGRLAITDEQKKQLGEIVTSILEADPSANGDYRTLVQDLKRDYNKKPGRTVAK